MSERGRVGRREGDLQRMGESNQCMKGAGIRIRWKPME